MVLSVLQEQHKTISIKIHSFHSAFSGIVTQHWIFTSHSMPLLQSSDSSSHLKAIWHKGMPCNWQHSETCSYKPQSCFISPFCSYCSLYYFKVMHLVDTIRLLFILHATETQLLLSNVHHP